MFISPVPRQEFKCNSKIAGIQHKNRMSLTSILGWITFMLGITLYFILHKVSPSILKLQFTFNEKAFQAIVGQWTDDDKAKINSHFLLDYAFLVAYGSFGYFLALNLIQSSGLIASVALFVMPIATICDVIENLLHQKLLSAGQVSLSSKLFFAAGLFASLKWLLIASYIIVLSLNWIEIITL